MNEGLLRLFIAVVTTATVFNMAVLIWSLSLLHKISKELRGEARWDNVCDPRVR